MAKLYCVLKRLSALFHICISSLQRFNFCWLEESCVRALHYTSSICSYYDTVHRIHTFGMCRTYSILKWSGAAIALRTCVRAYMYTHTHTFTAIFTHSQPHSLCIFHPSETRELLARLYFTSLFFLYCCVAAATIEGHFLKAYISNTTRETKSLIILCGTEVK